MKRYSILTFLTMVLSLWVVSGYAQADDIYYNPNEAVAKTSYKQKKNVESQDQDNQVYSYNDNLTASEDYDDEVYDYYYTSRIRRFHRPVYGFNYYDPYYTDLYYYDRNLNPYATSLIYDSPYAYSNLARSPYGYGYGPGLTFGLGLGFGAAYSPWGYNPYYGFGASAGYGFGSGFYGSPWGYGGYGSPWGYGGYGSPYGYGGGIGYGYGYGGYYCPPTYGYGYSYNTVDNLASGNSTYSPRTGTGVTTAPRTNVPRSTGSVIDRSAGVASPSSSSATVRDRYSRTPVNGRYSRSSDATALQPARTYSGARQADRSSVAPRSYTPSRSYAPSRSGSSFTTPSRSSGFDRSFTPSYSPSPSSSGSSISPSRSSSGSSISPARSAPAPSRSGGSRGNE